LIVERLVLAAILALSAGCSLVNATDACEVEAHETRVNERGDDVEHLGSSRGAAVLPDGRMVVAVVSATEDGNRSEVRVAYLEQGSGTHNILCGSDETERVVSDPESIAFRASAVAVDIEDVSNPLGEHAVVAVGWTSLPDPSGDPSVSIQLLDASGCEVGAAFPPVLPGQTGPVMGLGMAWSEVRGALYAVFHDGRQVLGAFLEAPGSTPVYEVLATEDQVAGDVVVAFAPDGRGIVAWEYSEIGWVGRGEVGVRAALLDQDGRVRPAAPAGGEAAPFRVDDGPSFYYAGHGIALTLAVDATDDRLAIAYETADATEAPPRVLLRELEASDGSARTLGSAAEGEPLELDGGSGAEVSPSVRYLPDGMLLASWESASNDGTMAILLDDDGHAAFTGLACDEGSFGVGARDALLPGSSTAVVAGEDLWIFHAGDSADDPVGTAVLGWHIPLDELRPGG